MTYPCSQCGHTTGLMSEAYLCPRTGQPAEPHIPVRRTTPHPPTPQTFNGPTLDELLKENRWQPRPQDRAATDSSPFLPESRNVAAGKVSAPSRRQQPTPTARPGAGLPIPRVRTSWAIAGWTTQNGISTSVRS